MDFSWARYVEKQTHTISDKTDTSGDFSHVQIMHKIAGWVTLNLYFKVTIFLNVKCLESGTRDRVYWQWQADWQEVIYHTRQIHNYNGVTYTRSINDVVCMIASNSATFSTVVRCHGALCNVPAIAEHLKWQFVGFQSEGGQ